MVAFGAWVREMLRLLRAARRLVVELDDGGAVLAIKPEDLRPL